MASQEIVKPVPVGFRTITFGNDNGNESGFFAHPVGQDRRPGIILVQEWWGLVDHIKFLACELASQGHAVLAPDLYKGKIASTSESASKLSQSLDQSEALSTLKGAHEYLKSVTEGQKIGIIGYCMGGTYSFLYGTQAKDLSAVVVCYGSTPSPIERIKDLEASFLGIYGELDRWLTPAKVAETEAALRKYGKRFEIHSYKADHAFLNNTRDAYNPEAAASAWMKTLEFFSKNLE